MSHPARIPFPTTDWRVVSRAGHGGAARQAAIGELLVKYLPALRSYLRAKWRVPPEGADDLLQGFVTANVLEQDLAAHARRERGRFRDLLVTALDRFVVSEMRREKAAKRGPGRVASLERVPAHLQPSREERPDLFDLSWARQTLDLALGRLREDCEVSSRTTVWAVFEARVVAPALDGAEPPPYEQLLQRFQFTTPEQASNLLMTAKRMFLRHLRAVVAEYADEDEVEAEIQDLRRVLAGGRG